jgi:hypothetical protein
MPYAADAAWTAIFSLMIASAIIGNLVVFWIVLGKCSDKKFYWIETSVVSVQEM